MGVLRLFSGCSYDPPVAPRERSRPRPLPNPDPSRFVLEKIEPHGDFVIAQIHYLDCTNYEGRKILVYEGVSVEEIRAMKRIDPHFCDGKHASPVARFKPTRRGWSYAQTFCAALSEERMTP